MQSPTPTAILVIVIITILALLFLNAAIPNRTDFFLQTIDQDIEGASQNHPDLVSYIQQLHVIQPPLNDTYHLKHPEIKDSSQNGQSKIVAELFKNKKSGTFLEAGAYNGEELSNTLFLERTLNWTGLLVEPDPWNFWALKKRRRKAHLLHGCLSPTVNMREVTFRQSDTMGRIVNSSEQKQNGIFTRVKCFPLYSLLLAQNLTKLDFLSLDVEGNELKVLPDSQILKTLPWDQIDITALLVEYKHIPESEFQLKKYLKEQHYKLYSTIGDDFLFVKRNRPLMKGAL